MADKNTTVIFLIKTSFPTISLMTLNVIELMNPIKSQRLSYWLKNNLTICYLKETDVRFNDTKRLKMKS